MPVFRRALVLISFAALGALAGCDPAEAPPPATAASAEIAPGAAACSLENAMLQIVGSARPPLNCGAASADTLCDEACRARVRECVLESVRARRPFTVAWTNGMNGGVGTRRAVIGRPRASAREGEGEPALDVTWLDLTWIDGFDAESATITKKRVRITRRRCTEIDDVAESCDPRLPVASPACASPSLADDAGLRCDAPEEILCVD